MKRLSQPCPSSNCDDCPDKGCGLLGFCGLQLLALLVPPATLLALISVAIARLV